MIVLRILGLLFWLLLAPAGMGMLFFSLFKKEHRDLQTALIAGYILMFALLEVIGIPVVLLAVYRGLTILTMILSPVLVAFASAGIFLTFHRVSKGMAVSLPYPIGKRKPAPAKWKVEQAVIWGIFFLLLGIQLYMAFTRASFDGDDAYYGAQAVIAQQVDTLYRVNPYTGRSAPLDVRHCLALFPIWEAMIGKLCGIHATILSHSILPLILIPLTYMVYEKIGRSIFRKKERLPMFMVLMALWQMFGNVSIYTTETFFLTRTWQGKSFAGNFVLPAVLWIFLELFKPVQRGEKRKQTGYWILLALLNLAGGASSSLAVLLSCLMSAGLSLIAAVWKRKPWIQVKTALSCIPGGIYVLFYLLLTHGIIG